MSYPRTAKRPGDPLRLAYLCYRGTPHVGGQGVYTRHLTAALSGLGHHVEVLAGQPYPVVHPSVALHRLPSLDIWNEHFPGRMPAFWELKTLPDFLEATLHTKGTFAEPAAFSWRAYQHLKPRAGEFDLVHDNQSLGWGVLAIQRHIPLMATIHHPITVDRRLEVEHAPNRRRRFGIKRWYAFTGMQRAVAQRIPLVVSVSENSMVDINADLGVPMARMRLVPVGVDPLLFRPMPAIARIPGRLITTASADVTLKGLAYLLEAIAKLRTEREISLVVIGRPKSGGRSARTIDELGLGNVVQFVSGVSDERIVELYAEAELAVVPSLYEGFSLPAIEAMATGTCLVSTTGGALPEVCGRDGETTLSCSPGDTDALASTLRRGLDDADLRMQVGTAGRNRVINRWSWRHTALATLDTYYEALDIAAKRR